MFNTILVPTDGSELSDKVIGAAVEFARINHAKLIGLSVAEPYPFLPLGEFAPSPDANIYEQKTAKLAQLRVQKVAAAAHAAHVPCETVTRQSFSPYEEIINAVKTFGCDAIFMASHSRKGIHNLLIGSETRKVLAHSAIPVLVFR